MQGLSACSRLSLSVVVMMFLLGLAGTAHGFRRRLVSSNSDEPCMEMTLYYHEILYNGVNNTANATSAEATKPSTLSKSTYFGQLTVFNNPVTEGKALPGREEEPAARAQGFYFYDKKESFNAWSGFSLVFNSTAHKGIINIMGADVISQKTRDLSVVGGSGDFFMTRGIATLQLDAFEGTAYFRLKMDIKLYECYVRCDE